VRRRAAGGRGIISIFTTLLFGETRRGYDEATEAVPSKVIPISAILAIIRLPILISGRMEKICAKLARISRQESSLGRTGMRLQSKARDFQV